MEQETAPAASSAVPSVPTVQYDGWDKDGEPIQSKPPKPAESAPAIETAKSKTEESTTSHAGKAPKADASASPAQKQTQEPAGEKPKTQRRFQELLDENKRLKQQLETAPKSEAAKPAAEAKPAPQAQPPQTTRPKPTIDQKKADGTAQYANYEEFVDALSDWKVERALAERDRQQQQQVQQQRLAAELKKAETRYGNNILEETLKPTAAAIAKDTEIPGVIRQMVNDSPVMMDLLYTLGSDPEELATFITLAKTNPRKAIAYVVEAERLIDDELKKETTPQADGSAARKPNGQFVSEKPETPASPKPRAPKPPSEVGGRGAVTEDALISAAKTNDFRAFEAEQTRRALASRR